MIQNSDDTIAAKAMYGQFGKKTTLIADKILEGRPNNSALNDDDDDQDEAVLFVPISFFCLLN